MKERSMEVKQLVGLTGMSRDKIIDFRNDKWSTLTMEELSSLCRVFGVTPGDLFHVDLVDLWYPIRRQREVTIHMGTWTLPAARGRAGDDPDTQSVLDAQCLGMWDVDTARAVHDYLNALNLDIRIRYEVHRLGWEGDEEALERRLRRVFTAGNHIIIGSSQVNPMTELALCRAFKVKPYLTSVQAEFPYHFVWDGRRPTASSFGTMAASSPYGIAATATGALVARRHFVGAGTGQDCGMIVGYRRRKPRVKREPRDEDERIIMWLLGHSGIGTAAAAQLAMDPVYAAALYPSELYAPNMRVIQAEYVRPDPPTSIDNRRLSRADLVPLS